MDTVSVIGLVTSIIINFLLAVIILSRKEETFTNRLFGFLSFGVAIWSLALLAFYHFPNIFFFNPETWIFLSHASAAFIAFIFVFFAFSFPRQIIQRKHWFLLLSIPFLIILFLLISSDWIIDGVRGITYSINTGYIFYAVYIMLYFSVGFATLWFMQVKKIHDPTQKKQIEYIIFGGVPASFFGMVTNLIFPYFGIFEFTWLGPIFTFALVFGLAVAILRYHLFNIKVIATEILVFVIWIGIVIRLSLDRTPQERFIDIGMLVLLVSTGILLIRSVLNEVRQKDKLAEAYRNLQKLDEAKSEFISIASHQLRTPLTAIKGYVSMMLEGTYGQLPEKVKVPIENIYASNQRLIKLVNGLLNLSRLEAGRIKMAWKMVSIEILAKDVLEELQVQAQEKNISLSVEESKERLPKVRMDEEKIRNVILNLTDNAIRYTSKGSISIAIKLQGTNKVRLAVTDTGAGMAKGEMSQLFKSFSRGGAGNTFWTEGTGLGLYVAKQFVDMHKGKIWAESPGRGKGSTFFVELPIKQTTQ